MTDPLAPPPRETGFDVIIALHGAPGRQFVSPRLAEALQDVYDIATSSLDFGSGFLDTAEIENLRILGKAIGAEPLHYQCQKREGYSVTRRDPWPHGPMKSVWLEARPCNCGAEQVIDVEVIPESRALES